MKKLITLSLALLSAYVAFAQVSGNINYQQRTQYSDNDIRMKRVMSEDVHVSVKGLANLKADVFVAIFSVSQVGNNAQEVNRLINERINTATSKIEQQADVETFVDMISFVPMYEYEVENKIFSKKTYHEIPAGFELKKNIHIKYTDPDLLSDIISVFSASEIYDLVRVDYFSKDMEGAKRELRDKAKEVLKEKIAYYEEVLSIDLDSIDKHIQDRYKVVLPVERYDSYQAYNSYSLQQKQGKNSNYTQSDKSTTMYYQPIVNKDFDFVMNPMILEPVIQVMYRLKVNIDREKKPKANAPAKTYYIISRDGQLKELEID